MSKKKLTFEDSRSFVAYVINLAGGTRHVADKFGITTQSINMWHQIPDIRCADVSALSGVPCEELRPDIFRVSTLKKFEAIEK